MKIYKTTDIRVQAKFIVRDFWKSRAGGRSIFTLHNMK